MATIGRSRTWVAGTGSASLSLCFRLSPRATLASYEQRRSQKAAARAMRQGLMKLMRPVIQILGLGALLEIVALKFVVSDNSMTSRTTPTPFGEFLLYTRPASSALHLLSNPAVRKCLNRAPHFMDWSLTIAEFLAIFIFQSLFLGTPVWCIAALLRDLYRQSD